MALGDAAEEPVRALLVSTDTDVRVRAERILAAVRLEPDAELTAVVTLSFAVAGWSHRSREYAGTVHAAMAWLLARRDRGALESYAITALYSLTGDRTLEPVVREDVRRWLERQGENGAWGDDWSTLWVACALDNATELVDNKGRVLRALERLGRHAKDPVLALHATIAVARARKLPIPVTAKWLCRAADVCKLDPRRRLVVSWASCIAGGRECRAWKKRWRAARWSDLESCAYDGWARWWGARDFHHRNVFAPRD